VFHCGGPIPCGCTMPQPPLLPSRPPPQQHPPSALSYLILSPTHTHTHTSASRRWCLRYHSVSLCVGAQLAACLAPQTGFVHAQQTREAALCSMHHLVRIGLCDAAVPDHGQKVLGIILVDLMQVLLNAEGSLYLSISPSLSLPLSLSLSLYLSLHPYLSLSIYLSFCRPLVSLSSV
jgi:hypothetical protein